MDKLVKKLQLSLRQNQKQNKVFYNLLLNLIPFYILKHLYIKPYYILYIFCLSESILFDHYILVTVICALYEPYRFCKNCHLHDIIESSSSMTIWLEWRCKLQVCNNDENMAFFYKDVPKNSVNSSFDRITSLELSINNINMYIYNYFILF